MDPKRFQTLSPSDSQYEKFYTLREKAKEKAIRDVIFRSYVQLIKLDPTKYIYNLDGEHDELTNYLQETIKYKTAPYALITINFPDDDAILSSLVKIQQALKRRPKYAAKMAYVYEYHTSGHNHPHIHLLIEIDRTKTKSEIYKSTIIQGYYRKFKFTGIDPEKVDVKMRNTWQNTLKYIKGQKKNKEKTDLTIMDAIWRKTHSLPPPYVEEFSTLESSENSTSLISHLLPPPPPSSEKLNP